MIMEESMKKVRHIVIFKYAAAAAADQIQQVTDALAALTHKIPGIRSFEHGVNNSPEKKNLGFTHVYQFTFDDAASRDIYLEHPDHIQFQHFVGQLGILNDAFVVDYKVAVAVDARRDERDAPSSTCCHGRRD
ncbi:Dabb family protein [Longimicrobium sp.]|uniref:Dabb family protein n=1 Tax=Longimicrobium sp. TaxID=2029185 RepID=UPI002F944B88